MKVTTEETNWKNALYAQLMPNSECYQMFYRKKRVNYSDGDIATVWEYRTHMGSWHGSMRPPEELKHLIPISYAEFQAVIKSNFEAGLL